MTQKAVKRFSPRSLVVIVAFAALLAAGVIVTLAFRTTTVVAHDNDEAAVRAALMQSAAGFERGDLAMLNRVYANDESVTIFESGHANYGWADYRDHHLVPEMKEFKNTKYALSDIKVKISGKTAWATYKYALAGDIKERHIDVKGLGTAVLEERGGNWVIVHSHTSAPRRAPAAAPSPAKK